MTSLEPEIITRIADFPVTNTLLSTILTDAVLIGIVIIVNKKVSLIPNGIQNIAEGAVEYFYTLTQQIAGGRANVIFPWFASFFIFIFFANLMGLIPGIGTFGISKLHEGHRVLIPFFRAATSDFNTTFALATISLVVTHILSIHYNGIKNYLSRFFSLNPVFLFVGLLELVSEITKLFSLSFRLFGNIFAGEIVLVTISSIFAYIAPIPFLMLESIVALVQALVFSMLTMVFMTILTTPHSEGGEH